MSDNEVEDVSFLPGETLHRRAVYEPNVFQKLKLAACTRGRAAAIATIGCMVLLIIALIVALGSHRSCPSSEAGKTNKSDQPVKPVQDYISTNGKHFPYKEIRLPKTVIPNHYKLTLHPNISQSYFDGTVEITCDVRETTDYIVFHSKELTIKTIEVQNTDIDSSVAISEWLEYKGNEQIFVKLQSRLSGKSAIKITVTFHGDLVKKLAGFYKSSYKAKSGDEKYIATTHFEPTDARAAFPCFDEPDLKATFEMSIIRDKNDISLFNMPLVKTETYKDDLEMDIFQKTVKMSTYLVAFVVCDYKSITKQTKRNITVSVYAPQDTIHAAQLALDTAVDIIDYYEDFFSVNYPLPKQDLIAIPDFAAGAMENWGLITYRETAVLYDPKVSSARNKQRVAVVIAHELAHQWFGNLVTMTWWDDLWLNEGFASFVEYIGSGIGHKDWKMDEQFVPETLLNAMYLDSLENSHPINLPVDNPNEINELFDTITYDKGASIIRMLSNFIGEDVFKDGLKSYLVQYKFSNAATNDLWNSLSEAVAKSTSSASTDVKSLMKTWTEQMGYPVVTVKRSGAKVTISQERFLLYNQPNGTTKFSSPFGYRWEIPFCYTTAENPDSVNKILLKDAQASFTVMAGISWIKGNCGMYGYYRVNYDVNTWRALIQQLHTNHSVFTATERAGLLDDAFMLARAGYLDYKIALDLSMYMVNEVDYIPWSILLDNLKFLQRRIEDKLVYKDFREYVMKLIKNMLDRTTWEDKGSQLDKFASELVLSTAVDFDHEPTIMKGKDFFQQWKNDHNSINVDLKTVIYRTGVLYGNMEDWETVWDAYLKESDASEKIKLLSVLGLSRDSRLLSRYLNLALNESLVRSQDAFRPLLSVSDSSTGQLLAWRVFRQNWAVYHDRYASASFILSSVIKDICSNFDTQFDYDEVQTFFASRDVGSGKRAVRQALEKIQTNIDWSSKYEGTVTDWLRKH